MRLPLLIRGASRPHKPSPGILRRTDYTDQTLRITSEFSVPAARTSVWRALLDPSVLLASIPGCEDLRAIDDDHLEARLVTSIAHITFGARIDATIVERVPPQRMTAVIQGEDKRLASALRVDATLALAEDGPARTVVAYDLEIALRGRLGRLGEPIFRRKARDMEAEFARRFQARLAEAPAVAAEVQP
jgi:hypothetical protein